MVKVVVQKKLAAAMAASVMAQPGVSQQFSLNCIIAQANNLNLNAVKNTWFANP
jgi:hypothetical protein